MTSSFADSFAQRFPRLKKMSQPLFFFGGFAFDIVTLDRIDSTTGNWVIASYLFILSLLIIVVNYFNREELKESFIYEHREWLPLIMQFCFGNLFSNYVIYYFLSSSLSKSATFMIMLILLLVLNEFLEKKLPNIYIHLGMYYLAGTSFYIFIIPILTKHMNYWTFLASTLVSLGIVGLLVYALDKLKVFNGTERKRNSLVLVSCMALTFNLFYLLNWIPPVPLSLKFGGIFHQVRHEGSEYVLKYEKPPWYRFWRMYDKSLHIIGDVNRVYCFTSIFAPTKLKNKIFHVWSYFSFEKNQWIVSSRIEFSITGGRDRGYRGYTYKTRLFPGKWRVQVMVESGGTLAVFPFEILEGQRVEELVELRI